MELVDCDLYKMQQGDPSTVQKYEGRYMQRYPWTEERIFELQQSNKLSLIAAGMEPACTVLRSNGIKSLSHRVREILGQPHLFLSQKSLEL